MLLGLSNGRQVALLCSRHKILWTWGLLSVLTIAVAVAYYMTRSRPDTSFKVPFWLIAIGPIIALLYAARAYSNSIQQFNTDSIELQLSGMTKKDYLNYKVGDDRAAMGFAASATSAGMLSGSNILGPFLRADNR